MGEHALPWNRPTLGTVWPDRERRKAVSHVLLKKVAALRWQDLL
jgi:hypothetical protein